jgi:hypothetical protein
MKLTFLKIYSIKYTPNKKEQPVKKPPVVVGAPAVLSLDWLIFIQFFFPGKIHQFGIFFFHQFGNHQLSLKLKNPINK